MIIPYVYKYYKRINCTSGEIFNFVVEGGAIVYLYIFAPNMAAIGTHVFNVRKNGVSLLAGDDRLTIGGSVKFIEKTAADFGSLTTARKDIISLYLDSSNTGNIMPDLHFLMLIDDGGETGGGTGGLDFEALAASLIAGENITLDVDDEAETITVSAGFESGSPGIPQNSKSAAYTTVLSDANGHIYHPASDNTARTFTIAANSSVPYDIGTTLTFINEANVVTITINSDTLVFAGSGATGLRTLTANGIATAIKVGATRWIISGTNLS